nr:MAG TPA: hypothetical protein [Caudoviricetes sp.]
MLYKYFGIFLLIEATVYSIISLFSIRVSFKDRIKLFLEVSVCIFLMFCGVYLCNM